MILAGFATLMRASLCLLAASFPLPSAAGALPDRESVTLSRQVGRATEIDLYDVYPYLTTRSNIRSTDIRSIACWMSLRRQDAGWRVIAAALHDARLEPGAHDPDRIDLRVGLVLSDRAGEFSSLYFETDLRGRPSPLRGVLNGRSVLVPAALAVAIHQVMGVLPRNCPVRH